MGEIGRPSQYKEEYNEQDMPEHPHKKHAGGHPPIIKTKEQMQELIDSYFMSCYKYDYVLSQYGLVRNPEWVDEDVTPNVQKYLKSWRMIEQPTISGLAVALGMDRRSVLNYSNREEFFPTLSRARSIIEKDVVAKLFDKGACNGAKFNLVNNFGHSDKTVVESSVTSETVINIKRKEVE